MDAARAYNRYEEYEYRYDGNAVAVAAIPSRVYEVPEAIPGAQVGARTRAIPKRRQRISIAAVLGFFVMVALCCVLTTLNAKLTAATTELYATSKLYVAASGLSAEPSVGLIAQREKLVARQYQLMVQYERTFDLDAIEEYAITHLGMVKAPQSAVRLASAVPDKAVIPAGAKAVAPGLVARILEYLK
ncbi:MAG: hypothetical protein LBT36_02580 [Oscillospiraceae bacterium]|jgi:hypothetical protein|nr:hypothetical protein [Oscillospiraceae bacterium]